MVVAVVVATEAAMVDARVETRVVVVVRAAERAKAVNGAAERAEAVKGAAARQGVSSWRRLCLR